MIKNLIESFVQELSKDDNKTQINNLIMPYVSNIKSDLKNEFIYYFYLLMFLLILTIITNLIIIYQNNIQKSFW